MNRILEKLQCYWQEQRRLLVLAALVLLFALISLLVNLPTLFGSAPGVSVADELKLLTEKQQELQELLQRKRQLQIPTELLRQQPERFWNPDTDGNPMIEFRRKVENAAQQSGMILRSIGALQNAKVSDGAMSYEISMEGQAKYGELLEFMRILNDGGKRKLFWNTLTINPDNTKSPNFFLFKGSLRTVAEAHPAIRKLWRAEP